MELFQLVYVAKWREKADSKACYLLSDWNPSSCLACLPCKKILSAEVVLIFFPENFHEQRVKLLAERGPSTNVAAMMSATSQQ